MADTRPKLVRIESDSSVREGLDSDEESSFLSGRKLGDGSRHSFELSQDYGSDNQKFIQYIKKLVERISPVKRTTIIRPKGSPPFNGMTYAQLAEHIISLRIEQIQRKGRDLVMKLFMHPRNFNIFNEPVDPVAQNIPHYPDIVKHPMDLGTIKSRLSSAYYQSFDECVSDIRLVFNNAVLFNGRASFVGRLAEELLNDFELELAKLQESNSKDVSILLQSNVLLYPDTYFDVCVCRFHVARSTPVTTATMARSVSSVANNVNASRMPASTAKENPAIRRLRSMRCTISREMRSTSGVRSVTPIFPLTLDNTPVRTPRRSYAYTNVIYSSVDMMRRVLSRG